MGSVPKVSGKEKVNHVKASWTTENHELFVDLCIEQISVGNRPSTHLNKAGWKNVLESFYNMTGLTYAKTQMKNHWDMTKKHWAAWHRLIATEHMKWDPTARTFGATEQEWNAYLKENPEAAQFRLKELLYADKLDIVFGGIDFEQLPKPSCGKKKASWSTGEEPSTTRPRKSKTSSTQKEHSKKHQYWLSDNTTVSVDELIGARPDTNLERCYDTVESRSVVTVQSPPPKLSYSIEECIKCLDSIEELEQGNELYLFALDIFLKKEYREIFLNLKKSSTRIAWLERMQTVGPPLPLH